jgi:hypothetical protein
MSNIAAGTIRRTQERRDHGEAEAAYVESRTVQHHERASGDRLMQRGQKDHDGWNKSDDQAEYGNPQQFDLVWIRCKRVDDRAWQHQVEDRRLQNTVIALPEQTGTFERIAGQNDQQQRNGLDKRLHCDSLSLSSHRLQACRTCRRATVWLNARSRMYGQNESVYACCRYERTACHLKYSGGDDTRNRSQ